MSEIKNPKRYTLHVRRHKDGKNGGRLFHQYSTKIKAALVAAGYQAALHDIGKTDLRVYVMESGNVIFDSDQLAAIAEREC